jgi:hypothetical protein
MVSKAFGELRDKVAAKYRKKGYSPARARYIGTAVAGEVAREKGKTAASSKGGKTMARRRDSKGRFVKSKRSRSKRRR